MRDAQRDFEVADYSLPDGNIDFEQGQPAGLMLVARNGHEHRLFRIASAVEELFAG